MARPDSTEKRQTQRVDDTQTSDHGRVSGDPAASGRVILQPRVSEDRSKDAGRRLVHGLVALVILVAIIVGLLLAVPGLHEVGRTVTRMNGWWVAAAAGCEILSCL